MDNSFPRYVPPKIETVEQLQPHVDAGKPQQNGHGYDDLVRWIRHAAEYTDRPPLSAWARRMNKDRRTIRNWYDIIIRSTS